MTTRRNLFAGLAALMAIGFAGHAPAQTDPRGASAFVRGVIDEGLSVIADGGAGDAQKRARLSTLVERSFDIDAVAGYVLGRFKSSLSDRQTAEFRSLYFDYVMAIYFSRLADVGQIAVDVSGATPQPNGDVVVQTAFARSGGAKPLNVGWRVRGTGDAARVLDIQTEGVSLAVTQRSEFTAVLRSKGYEGLTAAMRDKIAKADAAR